MAGFKAASTRRINTLRESPGNPVWQRNFHEHIVRHERELAAIRRYVRDNPAHWADDPER
ncbi:MAG TPA: hypothetical protein PKK12_00500 [Candidatus Aminicenantes bacterium]|nr:hypothetical protein [Candidatus Aminicenantes bacterium]